MLYKMQYQEYEANNMGHSQTRARPGTIGSMGHLTPQMRVVMRIMYYVHCADTHSTPLMCCMMVLACSSIVPILDNAYTNADTSGLVDC